MASRAQGYLATSDAHAIGVVNGTRVGGTRKQRTYVRASDCITYTAYTDHADGTRTIEDARIFRAARPVQARKTRTAATAPTLAKRDLLLQATMGTIHGEG